MAQFRVREFFYPLIEGIVHSPGDVIDLTVEQEILVAHMIEAVPPAKKTRKAVSDAGTE